MGGGSAKSPEPEEARCKILLVGEHGVGRTTLVKAYKRQIEGASEVEDGAGETASCNLVMVRDNFKGRDVKVLCMDSFNVEDFVLECRLKSIRNANLCLLVMDVSDRAKFEKVPEYVELLIKNDYSKTLVIVGTKGDLGTDAHGEVQAFMSEQHYIPIEYYVVSGKTGAGVSEVFQRAIELCLARLLSRWQVSRGLLFVYTRVQIEVAEAQDRTGHYFGNLCEAIPNFFVRRKKIQGFPVHKLSPKLLRQTVEFL
mmetsp:Transcript_32624/g.56667  ORF Transcript_32624/g.56667 Transcript_32624/m.56667 type:complete len:255 (+) Transcript_32624:3784-4548(+)